MLIRLSSGKQSGIYKMRQSLLLLLLTVFSIQVTGQDLTQTVRGTVTDKITGFPLPGATVIIPGTSPIIGTTTDADGLFRLNQVPVGKHIIRVSFLGYNEFVLPSLSVNSGKEVVLQIQLEESVIMGKEVVIEATDDRNKPLNEMAVVSARTFTVEETQKYAAAVNDPSRMATSFSGIVSTDDGNNQISIRGNAPNGLLWRMEGIEIPNPNHFANVGTTGGGISILSLQLMGNSDFYTGAFASEYGNALSGVFDIKLRKGNNEKSEYTFQAGVLGIDAAAEGPFSKKYKGSYLINYRYSTLSLLEKSGILPLSSVTNFQDLSFNISLPAGKAGSFSIFGFGGLSNQFSKSKKDSAEWLIEWDKLNTNFYSNTAVAGLTHAILIGKKSNLKSAVAYSGTGNGYQEEILDQEYKPQLRYSEDYLQTRLTSTSTFTTKFNSRHSLRAGVIMNHIGFDLSQKYRDTPLEEFTTILDAKDQMITLQGFSQWQFKVTEKITLNAGVHSLSVLINNTNSIEPRTSIRYELNEKQNVSLAYGLHSQAQPTGIYFVTPGNSTESPNKDLGLSRSHHLVAGYDRMLGKNLHVKTEAYYQSLFDIPVSSDTNSTLAIINNQYGFITDSLVNEGTGRNYGLELTLEKFLSQGYYFLLSGSLYQSEYRALDGVWRNTRFNGNYASSFTAGKEIKIGKEKKRILGINLKVLYAGGLRHTPIDETASRAVGFGVYQEDKAFTLKNADYMRADLRFSLKRNRQKTTSIISLDIQNATNRKNVGGQYYDKDKKEVQTWYQAPLIPILSYRLEF